MDPWLESDWTRLFNPTTVSYILGVLRQGRNEKSGWSGNLGTVFTLSTCPKLTGFLGF